MDDSTDGKHWLAFMIAMTTPLFGSDLVAVATIVHSMVSEQARHMPSTPSSAIAQYVAASYQAVRIPL